MKLDFPFYNDKNIKALDIFILAIMPILFTAYTFSSLSIPFGLGPYLFCFLQLGAFLFVARGKISLLIKKLSFKDIVRVIVTVILQFIFAMVIAAIIKFVFNVTTNGNDVLNMKMDIVFWIKVIVQLFGEELYKILIFLVVLAIMYKLTNKRTLSIVVATTISLVCFALIHITTYNSIIQILLLQGLASLICMYNYLKTTNILTSYLQHLLFDSIPFVLAMFGLL
jgi:hypothetical protein